MKTPRLFVFLWLSLFWNNADSMAFASVLWRLGCQECDPTWFESKWRSMRSTRCKWALIQKSILSCLLISLLPKKVQTQVETPEICNFTSIYHRLLLIHLSSYISMKILCRKLSPVESYSLSSTSFFFFIFLSVSAWVCNPLGMAGCG